jgi:hypothetical protein
MKTTLLLFLLTLILPPLAARADVEGEAQRWAGRQCRDQAGKKDKYDLCVKRKIKELQDGSLDEEEASASDDSSNSSDNGDQGEESGESVESGDAVLD